MSSWLFLTLSQVPYELLALVFDEYYINISSFKNLLNTPKGFPSSLTCIYDPRARVPNVYYVPSGTYHFK